MSKRSAPLARKDGGNYENTRPIKDKYEVLDLLTKRNGDSSEGRYIYTLSEPPEIRAGWFIDGDSGGARSGTDYYLIAPKVINELKEKNFVIPKREPVIGKTIIHDHRLVISDAGHLALVKYLDDQLVRASKLRRRRHKNQADYRLVGRGRQNISFGPLFYEFRKRKTLKTSHVYPELGKIKRCSN